MKFYKFVLIGAVAVILFGCNVPKLSPEPTPTISPSPIVSPSSLASPNPVETPKSWDNYKWYPQYEEALLAWYDKMPNLDKVAAYCPKWASLSDKKGVWVKLWKSVVDCECSFNLYSWMEENMGLDSVTGKKVRSEGLFQLSYQDYDSYKTPECAKFDWSKDKSKASDDHSKTIYDPLVNINCAMSIIKKHLEWGSPKWAFPPQAYWACLRQNTSGPAKFKKLAPECF